MNTYTVKEISSMLHTDPETVRRWIRNGKLKADKKSNKEGLVVTEKMLGAFLKSTPKYAGLAATSATAAVLTGGTTIAISAIIGAIAQGQYNKKVLEEAKIHPEELLTLLDEEIISANNNISSKKAIIKKTETEITKLEKKIEELNDLKNQVINSESEE